MDEVELKPGGLTAQVVSVSRQHQHTLEHTGLMCWQSCLPLAQLLLAYPSLTQGTCPCLLTSPFTMFMFAELPAFSVAATGSTLPDSRYQLLDLLELLGFVFFSSINHSFDLDAGLTS